MMQAVDSGNLFVALPAIFWELLSSPWSNLDVAWGVIPMYMSLVLGELYEPKPSPKNAVQGGANLLWAGIDWGRVSLVPLLTQIMDRWYLMPAGERWASSANVSEWLGPAWKDASPIILITTVLTIWLGIVSILVGVRKKRKRKLAHYFRYCRFSSYLCIMLYPLQTKIVAWSEYGQYGWKAVLTILLFIIPVWFLLTLLFQALLKLK